MQVVIDSAADNVFNDASCAVNMHNVTICAGIYKESLFTGSRGVHPRCNGVHSIMDMICNSSKSGIQLRGCHVNTSVFPCKMCAEAIINLQISKLIVLNFPNFFLTVVGSADSFASNDEDGEDGGTTDAHSAVEIYEAFDKHKIDVEFYGFPSLTMNLLFETASLRTRIVLFNEIFDEKMMNVMYNKFNHDYYKKRSYETSSCVFSTNQVSMGETTMINGVEHTIYNYTRDMMELKDTLEIITHRRYNMALMIFVDRINEFYTLIPNSCTLFMTEPRYMEFHFERDEMNVSAPEEISWDTESTTTGGANDKVGDDKVGVEGRTIRALLRPGSAVVIQTHDPSLYKPINFNSSRQTRKTLVITFV